MKRSLPILLISLLATGCSVEPPVPLERDPVYAELPLPAEERLRLQVAVAPVRPQLANWGWRDLPVAPVDSQTLAAPRDPGPSLELSPREYSWRPALGGRKLQERVGQVLGWAVGGGTHLLPHQTPAVELLPAADALGADLLLHVEIVDERVSWVERDGLWWWSNFLLFYGPGIYPVVLISDEVYAVEIAARASVIHTRTGYRVMSRNLLGVEQRSLSDPQRGWSLTGLFFLYPYTLDEDDYQAVHAALGPHARKDLEVQLAGWLREELPARLAEPEVRRLVELGDPIHSRTYALVVGANGPAAKAESDPGPLQFAEGDATTLAEHLLQTGTVASPEHLTVLTGARATRDGVLAALDGYTARLLGHDRLIVTYSGYGQTAADGEPALILDGRPLTLRDLQRACAPLDPRTQVTFVLDTSFSRGGKAFPGGELPPEVGYLGPLIEGRANRRVIAACGPRQTAWETEQTGRGLLTSWLLKSAAADADGDAELTSRELSAFLTEKLPAQAKAQTGYGQTPLVLGTQTPAALLRASKAESTGD